ncbi:hypothetical protein GCM10009531_13400 [Actinoplanes capillaceus]
MTAGSALTAGQTSRCPSSPARRPTADSDEPCERDVDGRAAVGDGLVAAAVGGAGSLKGRPGAEVRKIAGRERWAAFKMAA